MGPHDDQNNESNRPPPYFPPPHLPPETYNHLIQALVSLQGSASHGHPPAYPPPPHPSTNPNYPWPYATAPPIPPIQPPPVAGPSSFYPINAPIPPPPRVGPVTTGFSQLGPSPAATASDPEGSEDAICVAEDKRHRNTAASARFRVKKKIHTLNLERSVADLTGRTEELEREAADLRRENAWLKEIVVLRGRNLASSSAGSHASTGSRHGDGKDDSEPESSRRRKEKGKGKES